MRRWRQQKPVEQSSALAVEEPIEASGNLRVIIEFDGLSRTIAEALQDSLPRFIGRSPNWSGMETKLKQKTTTYGEVIDMADPAIEIKMLAPNGASTDAAEQIAWAEVKRLRRWLGIDDKE